MAVVLLCITLLFLLGCFGRFADSSSNKSVGKRYDPTWESIDSRPIPGKTQRVVAGFSPSDVP